MRLPRTSTVLARPVGLKADQPGTYSLDFHFGDKREVAATDIRVFKSKTPTAVEMKQCFECPVAKPEDVLTAVLYDEREEQVATGRLPVFMQFAHARLHEDVFDPIVIRFHFSFISI